LKDNFKVLGKDINYILTSGVFKKEFESSLFFLTLNKDESVLLNIVILNNYYCNIIECIETKSGKERKGYGSIVLKMVIDYGKKEKLNKLSLHPISKELKKYYEKFGFKSQKESDYFMSLLLN